MAYNPYEWTNGELITDVKLNHIENGIGSNSEDIEALRGAYGTPLVASSAADMTDTNKIYVYVGNESGYTNGHWYYYNGTAWADGGAYNATALVTDTTLSVAGMAADAKATGDAVDDLKSAIDEIIETNVLYDEDSVVVTGSSSFVYKDLLEISVLPGEVYTLKYDTLTGETASSAVGYIYAYNGTTGAGFVTLRKANKTISYEVPATGVNRLRFTLVPSQNGTQVTATYTGVQIIKGISAETSFNTELIQDGSIVPNMTDFFHVSTNLINPSETVAGEFVNQTNGNFNSGSAYTRTTYILIEPNESYLIKSSREASFSIRYAFYKLDRTFISGGMPTASNNYFIVTAPSDAAYIAISSDTFYTPLMLAKGNSNASFEAFNNTYILPRYIVDNVEDALINVPSKIFATTGIELNIYFENITENWKDFAWNVMCSKGKQLDRCYTITPTDADAGTYDFTIEITSKKNLGVSKSKTVSLVISASTAGADTSTTLIVLGDSTTNSGYAIEKLHENLNGGSMSVTTLGTRGTAPNNHEGRPGWKFSSYFNPPDAGSIAAGVENPWYNPTSHTFDAAYYFSTTGIAKPDWLFINLGINDVFGALTDTTLNEQIQTALTYCDSMIESIKVASPSTKIGVCYTIPPNNSQDAFGKAYGCGQTRDRYKHNNTVWVNALISKYDGRESDNIYTIPIHTNLDTVYNMGMETIQVNSRNTTTYQSPIGNGGVHPAVDGYWQIADVYTAFLKAQA